MDVGAGTPFLDFFRRGEVDREIRLMAARGELGLRPQEQAALLELLVNDSDAEVAEAAKGSAAAMGTAPEGSDAPEPDEPEGEEDRSALQRIAAMSPAQRVALAMKGNREERTILIRDPNKIVAVSVLSSPKVTDSEIESIAKMANVSDEVLRIIGNTRGWVKNYGVVAALARNPKTPVAISLNMLSRLYEKEVKALAADRNIPDALRIAARKRLSGGER
jgi:hypothetical protein